MSLKELQGPLPGVAMQALDKKIAKLKIWKPGGELEIRGAPIANASKRSKTT